MCKTTIAVLFGGVSSEHDIALLSAASVLRNLSEENYHIVRIGITNDGRWLKYDGPVDAIEANAWESDSLPAVILSPDRSHHGLLVLEDSSYRVCPIDCAFPVLHGRNGEGGTIQGLFALAGIPFVGCDQLSSAICMDKEMTHTVLDRAGIRTANWYVIRKELTTDLETTCQTAAEQLGYPIFVKPANAGSSVGISKAADLNSLVAAVKHAWEHDSKAILEETILGKEVECAVLGNLDNAEASALGRIIPKNEFYDYEAKYVSDSTTLEIPAVLDEATTAAVRETAVRAYRALGCNGLSRVDFFVKEDGGVILNEVNTIPGFTSISMYAKLWDYSGLPYDRLLDRLIQLALERKEQGLG